VIRVDGLTYWEIKCRALNGHRDRLTAEQLGFVGVVSDVGEHDHDAGTRVPAWLQPTNPSNIDKQLEELERLRDIAPGWFALARRIVEDEKETS
jgi:hypothetical protein